MNTRVPFLLALTLVLAMLVLSGCEVARPFAPVETAGPGGPTSTPRIMVSTDATATALAAKQTPGPTTAPGIPTAPPGTPIIPTAPPGTTIVPTTEAGGTPVPSVAPGGPVAPPGAGEVVYVVKRGDTLSGIAWRYGVTWQAIAQRNNLANPRLIYAGQRLIIPVSGGSPDGTVVHIVQPGESLWSIAQKYGTTVAAIAQANGITNPRLIHVGQRLVIPK